MAIGTVNLIEQDGRLGVLPAGFKYLAVMGNSDSGPLNTPAIVSRTKDLLGTYGRGAMVHAASYAINSMGIPVVVVRTGASTAATEATIDVTGVTGTSVVTYGADTTANDDYELWFQVVTGGTIGTAGITYRASLDGGRTPGPVTALGTATSYVFPNSGGVGFAFAAGTLVAGDVVRGRTVGPVYNSTELGAGLTALKQSNIQWEGVELCGALDSTLFDAVEAAGFAGTTGVMPKRWWMGHARLPTTGEADSAYQTSIIGVLGGKATTHGGIAAGAAKIISGIDFAAYRRPPSHALAARLASVKGHIDIADANLGALPGVDIRDASGNLDDHDERIHGGLDDARFLTLTTYDDGEIQGVYPTNPNLFSASGSDFKYYQHRRVINIARNAVQAYFTRVLSRPLKVNRKTGKILESEAVRLERGASAAVFAALMAEPMASGGGFADGSFVKLSRDDLILSTFTLSGQCSVVPLAYPKTINIEIGYTNPALILRQV